ncbi:MAG: ECF-type sigma factor [Pirellulales bacterium]|nr:ECF-type sigma factor [Pirellulales bacterium]
MPDSESVSNQNESVSLLIEELKQGNQPAAQEIWTRYLSRLATAARKYLGASSRRVVDEDDVANEAFAAFLRGVDEGRFSDLNDRADLWQILVSLVERKAHSQTRFLLAGKRGNGQIRGDSVFYNAAEGSQENGFASIPDPAPTGDFVAMFCDQFRNLLDQFDEERIKQVMFAKLENHTNKEIAELIGVSQATVERKLALIRNAWERMNQS